MPFAWLWTIKGGMGPPVSAQERDRYEALMARAKDESAHAATGGGRPADFNRGWFVDATVPDDCAPEMRVFHNESFGPAAIWRPLVRHTATLNSLFTQGDRP